MSQRKPTTEQVHLSRQLADTIVQHAFSGYPEEVCGIVRGRGKEAYEIVPAQNLANDRLHNYTVDTETLLLQFTFEEEGDEMMGVYHSHPASQAYPSATDAWHANYPDAVYFICTLQDRDQPAIRAFRLITTPIELSVCESMLPGFHEMQPGVYSAFVASGVDKSQLSPGLASHVRPPYYVLHSREHPTESRIVEVVELAIRSDE